MQDQKSFIQRQFYTLATNIINSLKNVKRYESGLKLFSKSGAGFTIIELIVVIAIIAVLATIVMINVTSYIGKSKDAAIKGNMTTIASTAAGVYDAGKSYNNATAGTLVANVTVTNALTQINTLTSNASNTIIAANTSSWCVCAQLTGNFANTYCADSQGYRNETNGSCGTRCNATSQACIN